MFKRTTLLRPRNVFLPLIAVATGSMLVASQAPSSLASDQRAVAACTLNVPATISINSPSWNPPMSLGSDCATASVIEAKWEAKDAAGNVMNKAFFNRTEPTKWPLFDGVTLGTWSWQPTGARGAVDPALAKSGQTPSTAGSNDAAQATVEIPQNTPTTIVRVKTEATWLVTTITDPCVLPLRAYGSRYNPSSDPTKSDGMSKYEGGRGSFQQLQRGSTTWTTVSGATLPASGQLQINIPWPKITTHYRFVLYDTTTAWGSLTHNLDYDPAVGC